MNTYDASNSQFLRNLNLTQARAEAAEQQMSSGYRVTKASDDPSVVNDILNLNMEMARTTQIKTNLGMVKSEVDTAESTLGQAALLIQKAVSTAAGGASTTATDSSRQALAQQVQDILSQVVGLSQTQVQGRYIFSGDSSTQMSYQMNLANANGVDRLATPTSTRLVEDATGMTFAVARTAQDIFDHRNADDTLASDNVFAALNGVRTALLGGDATVIQTSLDTLKKSGEYLNNQQQFYGTVQTRIASAQSTADDMIVREKADRSTLRDADVAAAAIELTQAQFAANAAMSAHQMRSRNSLFDYLK